MNACFRSLFASVSLAYWLAFSLLSLHQSIALVAVSGTPSNCRCLSSCRASPTPGDLDAATQALDAESASNFKVVTCMSTNCSNKRKSLGLDSLSTFGAFHARSTKNGDGELAVLVEEGPCLGCCRYSPCVGIEHNDYFGRVSLEGMTNAEFRDRAFHTIITEEDADRVWTCVMNAVQVMAAAEATESEDM